MDQFFNNAAQCRQLGHLRQWRCRMCSFGKPGSSKMGPASLGVHHHEHILGGSLAAQERFMGFTINYIFIWWHLKTTNMLSIYFLCFWIQLQESFQGWFPLMGVLQNGLLLKSMIGQFSWGGGASKFMPTGLPICFPRIAELGASCIFQKNVDGNFWALVC